jgi:hypothetical protein
MDSKRIELVGRYEEMGYVILTIQPDGSWQPDWDGLLHKDFHSALDASYEAVTVLGPGNARLSKVVW